MSTLAVIVVGLLVWLGIKRYDKVAKANFEKTKPVEQKPEACVYCGTYARFPMGEGKLVCNCGLLVREVPK